MVWLIIAGVIVVFLMATLYACLIVGARADRDMERMFRGGINSDQADIRRN